MGRRPGLAQDWGGWYPIPGEELLAKAHSGEKGFNIANHLRNTRILRIPDLDQMSHLQIPPWCHFGTFIVHNGPAHVCTISIACTD